MKTAVGTHNRESTVRGKRDVQNRHVHFFDPAGIKANIASIFMTPISLNPVFFFMWVGMHGDAHVPHVI